MPRRSYSSGPRARRTVFHDLLASLDFLPNSPVLMNAGAPHLEAWRLGLEGITIYRSGSQSRQVLTLGAGEDATSREFFVKCDPGACRL